MLKDDIRSLAKADTRHLTHSITDVPAAKRGSNRLHRKAVQDSIRGYRDNVVLGGYPPPISEEERTLPRKTRCTLAQLRSGQSTYLQSYQAKLNAGVDPTCPDCGGGEHTTNHLFMCPSNLTTLVAEDLWNFPRQVAQHLKLM